MFRLFTRLAVRTARNPERLEFNYITYLYVTPTYTVYIKIVLSFKLQFNVLSGIYIIKMNPYLC